MGKPVSALDGSSLDVLIEAGVVEIDPAVFDDFIRIDYEGGYLDPVVQAFFWILGVVALDPVQAFEIFVFVNFSPNSCGAIHALGQLFLVGHESRKTSQVKHVEAVDPGFGGDHPDEGIYPVATIPGAEGSINEYFD
jgi:hypothetical protein